MRRLVGVRGTARAAVGRAVLVAVMLLILAPPTDTVAQIADRTALLAALDSTARAHVASEMIPGVSLAVVVHGETLLQRGYGEVDLEWDVPTPEDGSASYEIGSITKQFTAAAVLLLAQEGRLDLDADITAYLDFDTKGRSVPVRRLLDHTSGIKGYTEMSVFGELAVRDLPRDTLLRLVEREPFEFEPGTALIYNNSAYFLLGLIIEKVSGRSYEDFVRERLFEPVGMADSYYCSESRIRDGRAHGYDAAGADSLVRANYLDHTWPYAAGSLCSTVGDLVRWNLALHGGGLLEPDSYHAMTTPRPLVDGTLVRYAMGLGVDAPGGRRVIAHGGGINGFLSDARYYPDEELIVVVLQNATGPTGPAALSTRLVELVLGPVSEPPARTFTGDLGGLTGRFRGAARGQAMTLQVLVEDGRLGVRIGEGQTMMPPYVGDLTWVMGNTRITFVRRSGPAEAVRFDTGSGHYVLERIEG